MCRDLADGLHIPYPYLSKLMQQCARLGIVTASRGRHGGYRLLQDPERMSLLAIVQAIGGDRVTKECLLGFKECSDESACVMHCQWRPLKEGLFELLRDQSVARLADAVRDGRCRLGGRRRADAGRPPDRHRQHHLRLHGVGRLRVELGLHEHRDRVDDRKDVPRVRRREVLDTAQPRRVPQLDADTRARWSRSYGSLVSRILERGELGASVAPGVHEAELHYLREHEWARDVDDVLWRRSKLGLHLSPAQRDAVATWWAQHEHDAPLTA
jgi:Rrf2 family protein